MRVKWENEGQQRLNDTGRVRWVSKGRFYAFFPAQGLKKAFKFQIVWRKTRTPQENRAMRCAQAGESLPASPCGPEKHRRGGK